MDCLLFRFMRGHLGHCCVLECHHNFPRPTSEQRPCKALLSSAQGRGQDKKGSRVGRRTASEKGAAARVLGHRLLQAISFLARPWQ